MFNIASCIVVHYTYSTEHVLQTYLAYVVLLFDWTHCHLDFAFSNTNAL